MQELIDQIPNRYKDVSILGKGGMGIVCKAYDITLELDVAIKVMHPDYAQRSGFQDRFLQEARAAVRLQHPGIVRVFDIAQARSLVYIVMEFIPGDNLRVRLQGLKAQGQVLVLDEAVRLTRQVCLALDYAHQQEVLHRDIKPDNIMLKPKPCNGLPYQPVITDLGLAKLTQDQSITQTGVGMGTPAYVSPEQARGLPTDVRSDVYSLGAMLYELVAGHPPFPASSISEAIRYHKQDPPPPRTQRPDVPEHLEQVILKALARDPDERLTDAATLAQALAFTIPAATQAVCASTAPQNAVSLTLPYQESLFKERGLSIIDEFDTPSSDHNTQDTIQVLAPGQPDRFVPMRAGGLTIGRADDNDLVLDDPQVSGHHIRVEYVGSDCHVVDRGSTNGTRLANRGLLPGLSAVWAFDVPLRIGDTHLRLLHGEQPENDDLYRSDGSKVEPGLIHANDRLDVVVEPKLLTVEPGSSVSSSVIIRNRGVIVDHFQVSVDGIPAAWMPSRPPLVKLMPNRQQEATLIIQPPRSPHSRAGEYPLVVRVVSQANPGQEVKVDATLTVTAYHQFNLDLRPQKQRSMAEGNFRVQALNQGNADLLVRLEGLDPEEACLYTFDPPQVTLLPGEERLVGLKVRSRALLSSELDSIFHFTVTARPVEVPELVRQVQGVWVQILPKFELRLDQNEQSGIEKGNFDVQVLNQGDAELALQLEAADLEGACLYAFDPPQLTLHPGTERRVGLTVKPKDLVTGESDRTFRFTIAARSVEVPELVREVQGVWVQTLPKFELRLDQNEQSGIEKGNFDVQVLNQGDADLALQLEAADLEGACLYAFDPPQLTIPPGTECRVGLTVKPKDLPPGGVDRAFRFTVTARPDEAPGLVREVQGVWVQTLPEFELCLDPERGIGRNQGSFNVHVNNPCHIELTLQLEAIEAEEGCLCTFDSPQVVLQPGEERDVKLTIQPQVPPPKQGSRTYLFTLAVRPDEFPGLAQQVQGEWKQLSPPAGWMFWLGWVLATTVGWIGGWIAGGIVGALVNPNSHELVAVGMSIIVAGAFLGTMQWLVLRQRIPGTRRWILATTGGIFTAPFCSLIGYPVLVILGVDTSDSTVDLTPVVIALGVILAAIGALIGTIQWFVLRRRVRRAGWLVLANIAGWLSNLLVITVVSVVLSSLILSDDPTIFESVEEMFELTSAIVLSFFILCQPVAGVITGAALVRLLRQPAPEA